MLSLNLLYLFKGSFSEIWIPNAETIKNFPCLDRPESTTCATIGPKVDVKVQQNQFKVGIVNLPPQPQFINFAGVENIQVVNAARRERRRNPDRFRQLQEEYERQYEGRLQQDQQQVQPLFQQRQDHHRQFREQIRVLERQLQQEHQRQLMEQQRQEQERQRQAQDQLRQVQQRQLQQYRNDNV